MSYKGYEAIWPGLEAGVPKPLMPYSPAIRADDWVFIAGTIASDFQTGLAPEVIQDNPFLKVERGLQAEYLLGNLSRTIEACGCDIKDNMVRMWHWHVADCPTPEDFERGDHSLVIEI